MIFFLVYPLASCDTSETHTTFLTNCAVLICCHLPSHVARHVVGGAQGHALYVSGVFFDRLDYHNVEVNLAAFICWACCLILNIILI